MLFLMQIRMKPNAWGLYDMSGNVSELTEDCWGFCVWHVRRGGGWSHWPADARSAKRGVIAFDAIASDVGFRVARTLP